MQKGKIKCNSMFFLINLNNLFFFFFIFIFMKCLYWATVFHTAIETIKLINKNCRIKIKKQTNKLLWLHFQFCVSISKQALLEVFRGFDCVIKSARLIWLTIPAPSASPSTLTTVRIRSLQRKIMRLNYICRTQQPNKGI